MPTLIPDKRAQLADWLREFASDFAQQAKGVAHLAKYTENRRQGQVYYARVKADADAGKDITDGVLDTLLPHGDTPLVRARGAWVHVAPVLNGDIRLKFENAGWVRRESWPDIARIIFGFFESCEREPEHLQRWCNEFVKHPLRKGFKAGFLSPMLNALHPEKFAIVNKKPLALLSWAYDDKFTSSVENYARTTTFLHQLSGELESQLKAAVGNEGSAGDALDMFAHWLVTTGRLRGVTPQNDGEEDEELVVAKVEEAAANRLWLIAAGRKAEAWSLFQSESCIAMDWAGMDNLLAYPSRDAMTEALRTLRSVEIDRDPTNGSLACWEFSREIQPGDLVMAKEGKRRLLGVGVVVGAYSFSEKAPSYRHRLPVRWMKTGDWMLRGENLPLKTLTEVTDLGFREALGSAVGGFEARAAISDRVKQAHEFYGETAALAELFMTKERLTDILGQLQRKKNIVLQGPPGVGKTFVARRLAWLLLGAKDDHRIEMVQFHPSMSYEDFVLGFRPDGKGGFALKPGVFHRFCRRALDEPERPYVFIIDEINRGNLAKIFGELLMLVEADKRGVEHAVSLAYGEETDGKFHLPSNLHIIGTMNTADRSLALVDYALRRRFAFMGVEPDFGPAFKRQMIDQRGCPESLVNRVCDRITVLNRAITTDSRSLGRGYQIGHSFFCSGGRIDEPEVWYRQVIEFEIRPLLEEYWMDDPAKAATEVAKLLATP